jgi:hypothetical protein
LRPPKLVTETLQQLFDWVASERECEKVAEGASTMTMLDEAKPNGHAEPAMRAWDARLTAIERRLAALPAEIAETGERRVVILRDALADFAAAELAKRDEEIVSLKNQLADLQQKLEQQAAIDQRVHEISACLEERQARRDRGQAAE